MYALIIGRAYPDEKTGMMGIFEYEQAVALNNYGIKTVYSFCDTRSIKRLRRLNYTKLVANNVPVYGYHFPIGGAPRKTFDKLKGNRTRKLIRKVLDEHGIPDIIHIHFPLLNLNNEIWDYLISLNRPIVVTEHWTKVQTKEIELYRRKLLKRIVNESDTFICVGDQLKRSVVELTGTEKEIKIIPNMLNPFFYYKEQKNKKDTFNFITIGRLVEVKRFGFTIDAFTKEFSDNKNVHLHVVGDGPLFNSINEQINNLGMSDKITMHGFLSRNETSDLIRECDAFVSASILETFGVPFIEAMACGKPVIGAKNGLIDRYIINNHGVLFERDNLKDLTNSLRKVYANRYTYNGKVISQTAINMFSEKAVAQQLNDVYLRLT